MRTITDSLLYRLGIYDDEQMPINPVIRWDHDYPAESITIQSAETEMDRTVHDSEVEFDLALFGDEEDGASPYTDEEFERLIESLGYGTDEHMIGGNQ